jgi:hypothetical protein
VRKLLAISLLLFLLFGALGLKTKAECDSGGLRASKKITCYHLAAVSEAYKENSSGAQGICNDIWFQIGNDPLYDKSDIKQNAETVRNLCMYDIAQIIARLPPSRGGGTNALSICDNIQQDKYSTTLAGAPVTKDMCINDVARIASIGPEIYSARKDNICSIVFVLPLILFAAIKKVSK